MSITPLSPPLLRGEAPVLPLNKGEVEGVLQWLGYFQKDGLSEWGRRELYAVGNFKWH